MQDRTLNREGFTLTKVLVLLTLFTSGFVIFYGLNYPSVRMWDESRLAVNAVEMLDNRQWFVTYYDGEPDLWNTKPPLMIWLISLCMSLFGVDTLALRLPSAIAAACTTAIVVGFCSYFLQEVQAGLLSALVLVTSLGYIGEHVTRGGDYDSVLVLWITVCSLALFTHFNRLTQNASNSGYLWIAGITFVLAFWTKGIAAGLVLPGIFLWLVIQPRLLVKVLQNPQSYYVALFCLLFSLLPYLIREVQNPGYIQAVFENDLGRYGKVVEAHDAPNSFYFEGFWYKYKPWIYLWLPCSLILLSSKQALLKAYATFSLFYQVSFIIIISLAQSKLVWYDAPVYPLASLNIGIGIHQIYLGLSQIVKNSAYLRLPLKAGLKLSVLSLGMVILFSYPCVSFAYKHIYKNHGIWTSWNRLDEPTVQYGDYFKQLLITYPAIKQLIVPLKSDEYNAHLLFYAKKYNREGYNIQIEKYDLGKDALEKLSQTPVVTCNQEVYLDITRSKKFEELHRNNFCFTLVQSKPSPSL